MRLGYNHAYQTFFDDLQLRVAPAGLNSASKVLDVGIGSAGLSLALIDSFQFDGELHGVDISLSMLQQADWNLRQSGHDRTMLKQAPVQRLPYPDHTFDFVMTAHVLEHLSDSTAGISEMLRVLKPGGELLVIMTRQGLWGQWIRWKWDIRPMTQRQLRKLVTTPQTDQPQVLPFGQGSWIRWASSAVLTQKRHLHHERV